MAALDLEEVVEASQTSTMRFDLLKTVALDHGAARVGRLAFHRQRARLPIDTPNFIAITSRGSVPHMTPDVVTRHTQLGGAYMALEDFVELSQKRKSPALYKASAALSRLAAQQQQQQQQQDDTKEPSATGLEPASQQTQSTSSLPTSIDTRPGALHFYTATPPSQAIVLAPRRHPAVTAPMGNGADYVSLFTSTGFQKLRVDDYCAAVADVQPDIAIPLSDLTYGYADEAEGGGSNRSSNPKRQLRMVERTEDWIARFFGLCTGTVQVTAPDVAATKGKSSGSKKRKAGGDGADLDESKRKGDATTTGAATANTTSPTRLLDHTAIFAPTLPVPYSMQWDYLNRLSQDHRAHISGLAVYDADILADLGDYPALTPLPRLSMEYFMTPHKILRQVQLGMDLFTVPFVNTTSDAGIAMTFQFVPTKATTASEASETDQSTATGTNVQPLGIDMWSESHRTALAPLLEGCTCYVCTKHHRAFLQHLLNAKEMLGWTLLQIHNHHVVSQFFADMRRVLSEETPETFNEYCRQFQLRYESELPKGTGERPRARGYHFKAEAGQPKINKPVWEKYEAGDVQVEAGNASAQDQGTVLAGDDKRAGVAPASGTETPVVPEGTAGDLVEKGFAEQDSTKQ